MTATQMNPNTLLSSIMQGMRQGLRWFAKGMVALALVVLAGILAVMTAIAGLVIASVALMIRLIGSKAQPQSYEVYEDGEGLTLEARKTPRGWTVE